MGGGGGIPDPTALVNLFQRPDLIGVFALFLVALLRGWLVLGREYEYLKQELAERTKERDVWMQAALHSTQLGEQATTLAERRGPSYGPPQGYGQGGMPPTGHGPQGSGPPRYGSPGNSSPQTPPTYPPQGVPPVEQAPL